MCMCVCVCVRARMRLCACVCVRARACVYMRACVRARACVRTWVSVCVCGCVCVRACVDEMNLSMHYVGISTYIGSFRTVHMHMHTRILKPFEDSGLEVDIALSPETDVT